MLMMMEFVMQTKVLAVDETAYNYNELATDAGDCVFLKGFVTLFWRNDGTGVVVDNDDDGDGVCGGDETNKLVKMNFRITITNSLQ